MNHKLTDAKLIELDMQDLEFSHKFRELKKFCYEMEELMWKFKENADKTVVLAKNIIDNQTK